MKFSVNKTDFFVALQKVIGVIPTKTTIPILGNILLRLEDETLFVSGTDLEISIKTSCTVYDTEEGAVAVPGRKLFEIIRELPEIPITLAVDDSNNITLSTDKGMYRFVGETDDQFPQIGVEDAETSFSIVAEKYMRMIDKTAFAVSTDELRTTLMGVLMEIVSSELRMIATDGHRLAKICDKSFHGSDQMASVILPTKALHLVAKNFEPDAMLNISIGDSHVTLADANTTIYSKVIEGQFPNYERVIPIDNDIEMVVNRELLISSVKRVSIFSSAFSQQVKFNISPSSLVIQSEDIDVGGEAQESIPVDYSGDAINIGYNAQYIQDVLRHLDTEEVIFKLRDGGSAAIVRPSEQVEDEDLMMLIMPIKLNDTV
ncbi:MAG TPA: DNA polymerase III subunit beta [Bacteroidetes bacterium]|nr:DNA polymerase III subunit beta [Bacteroidota bacterium]